MRGKFSFLYVDIWFDVTKCKFIVKNSSFEMLVVFLHIFVADTKITFVYNFVAPLNLEKVEREKLQKIEYLENEKSLLDEIKPFFSF